MQQAVYPVFTSHKNEKNLHFIQSKKTQIPLLNFSLQVT